ncbi:MAG: hypothetical protein ACHQ1D_00600 [Nitrososphaerales archaeon]
MNITDCGNPNCSICNPYRQYDDDYYNYISPKRDNYTGYTGWWGDGNDEPEPIPAPKAKKYERFMPSK